MERTSIAHHVYTKYISADPRLTCSNVTATLFDWVVCNAGDRFPIEGIYGGDIQSEDSSSAAGVA